MQSINTMALKIGKVSKLIQRKLILCRSKVKSEAFRKVRNLEILQDSYFAYRDLTIKLKFLENVFLLSCLINPTAERSSKN